MQGICVKRFELGIPAVVSFSPKEVKMNNCRISFWYSTVTSFSAYIVAELIAFPFDFTALI